MATNKKISKTVPLNWKEVYFTNCCMVAANNIDQELGWCKTDFKKIGIDYSYFRSRRENDYYPHYIHNLDNLIRFGGLYPPIHVHAGLEKRFERKDHAVIVVAEGAGQNLMQSETSKTDMSSNAVYDDIGLFLKDKIKEHFKSLDKPVSIKYIDPSYNIRSCQANARDSILCLMLGENAVHAAMAGKTDMFIGFWNQSFTHVPFSAAIGRRKKVDLSSQFWQTVKAMTE